MPPCCFHPDVGALVLEAKLSFSESLGPSNYPRETAPRHAEEKKRTSIEEISTEVVQTPKGHLDTTFVTSWNGSFPPSKLENNTTLTDRGTNDAHPFYLA